MASTYITPCTPSVTQEFVARPETCVKIGTGALYDSLETTTWCYTTYEASIGMKAGQFFQLGTLAAVGWSHKPTFEPMESANISDDSIWEVTGEETLVTIEVQQLDPRIFELAIGTGTMYTLSLERLITFGGGCSMRNRPISLEFVNEACGAPTSQDASAGLTGGVVTLYDCFITSGLEWTMNAKEPNTIPLEFQARPVLARARGNRLGSVILY